MTQYEENGQNPHVPRNEILSIITNSEHRDKANILPLWLDHWTRWTSKIGLPYVGRVVRRFLDDEGGNVDKLELL